MQATASARFRDWGRSWRCLCAWYNVELKQRGGMWHNLSPEFSRSTRLRQATRGVQVIKNARRQELIKHPHLSVFMVLQWLYLCLVVGKLDKCEWKFGHDGQAGISKPNVSQKKKAPWLSFFFSWFPSLPPVVFPKWMLIGVLLCLCLPPPVPAE